MSKCIYAQYQVSCGARDSTYTVGYKYWASDSDYNRLFLFYFLLSLLFSIPANYIHSIFYFYFTIK